MKRHPHSPYRTPPRAKASLYADDQRHQLLLRNRSRNVSNSASTPILDWEGSLHARGPARSKWRERAASPRIYLEDTRRAKKSLYADDQLPRDGADKELHRPIAFDDNGRKADASVLYRTMKLFGDPARIRRSDQANVSCRAWCASADRPIPPILAFELGAMSRFYYGFHGPHLRF